VKLSPAPKEDIRSATIVPTMLMVVGCSLLLVLTVYASDPAGWHDPGWWTTQGAVEPTSVVTNANGTVTTNYSPELNAVANQGQLRVPTSGSKNNLQARTPRARWPRSVQA